MHNNKTVAQFSDEHFLKSLIFKGIMEHGKGVYSFTLQ